MARDSYSYLHFPMVAGIVLLALGLKKTLEHVDDPLKLVPAVAMLGGAALYLLAHVAFRWRNVHRFSLQRLLAALAPDRARAGRVELPALATLAIMAVALGGADRLRARALRGAARAAAPPARERAGARGGVRLRPRGGENRVQASAARIRRACRGSGRSPPGPRAAPPGRTPRARSSVRRAIWPGQRPSFTRPSIRDRAWSTAPSSSAQDAPVGEQQGVCRGPDLVALIGQQPADRLEPPQAPHQAGVCKRAFPRHRRTPSSPCAGQVPAKRESQTGPFPLGETPLPHWSGVHAEDPLVRLASPPPVERPCRPPPTRRARPCPGRA